MKSATALAALIVSAAACSDSDPLASVTPPPPGADSCAVGRPDFGGAATQAELALFSYDIDAPLNLQKTLESTINGVEVSQISFTSPDGGLVTGLMWDPVARSGPRPAMVVMHGMPNDARDMTGLAQNSAQKGAVVIAIDAPFNRRSGSPVRFTSADSAEQVQLMKDLQRAVDVLLARPNVDPDRIAYLGVSFGGAMGALFVGIERRLKAAVLIVGDGGLVTHSTGPEDFTFLSSLSCATRVNWFRAMVPIEPIRFIGHANVPLLLQNGRLDELVPEADGEALQAAAPQPKDARWYEAGHGLNQQATVDRYAWLSQQIGIDP